MDDPSSSSSSSSSAQNSEATVTYLTSIFGPILNQRPGQWMLQNQLALNMAIRNAYNTRIGRRTNPNDLSKKYLQRLRDRGRLTLLKNVHKYGERSQDHALLKQEVMALMRINEHRVDALMGRVFLTQTEPLRNITAANLISESVNHFIPYAWVNLEDGSERWGPIPDFIQVKKELATNGVTNVAVVSLWLNMQMANLWAGDWGMYDHLRVAKMHNTGRKKWGDAMIGFTPIMKEMIKSMLKLSMVRMKKAIEKRARTVDRGGGSDSDSDGDDFMN